MKIFLDTANIDEIKAAVELGIIDGITTNPSLVAGEKTPFLPLIKQITAIVPGPVSVEVTALDVPGMLKQAREYAALASNVVIKVPINREALQVVSTLKKEGIKTNVTLIFSACQALLAAKAGAAYVSPFVGRIDDISGDGMELVDQIKTIFEQYDFDCEIIVASIRNPLHVVQSAMIGADVATIPPATLGALLRHPLTDTGMAKFLADWQKAVQA